MAETDSSKDEIDFKSHLQNHVSNSDFAELRTNVKWITWILGLVLSVTVLRWIVSIFETS